MDTLKTVGCTAYDLAQHFEEGDIEVGKCYQDSDKGAEIAFLNQLDVLDVLAVCCSIHQV